MTSSEERVRGHSAYFDHLLTLVAPEYYFQPEDNEESSWTRFHFNKRRQPGSGDTKRKAKRAKVNPDKSRPTSALAQQQKGQAHSGGDGGGAGGGSGSGGAAAAVSESFSFGNLTRGSGGGSGGAGGNRETRRVQRQKALLRQQQQGSGSDPAPDSGAAWTKALGKARGERQLDDPRLLKKSLKQEESRKRKSTREWEARVATQDKMKADRQEARRMHISKLSEARIARKVGGKKAKSGGKGQKKGKKGKARPGFEGASPKKAFRKK